MIYLLFFDKLIYLCGGIVCHENQTAVVGSWFATSEEMVVGPPHSVNKH